MSFILLFLGLLLILIEFYIPGAVIGIIGSVLVLLAIIQFASESTSLIGVILFIIGAAVAVGLVIRFALCRIVKAKPGYSIYSNHDQEGFKASSYDVNAIGKIGTVLSDLKPGGYILIDGQQHQALSISGYIPQGSEVIVVSGQEESLIVQLVKKESKS